MVYDYLIEKKYRQSPKGKKTQTIKDWKKRNIIDTDYSLLYDCYIAETHCWICGIEFNNDISNLRRCLDHDHETGEPRYICCSLCNLSILREYPKKYHGGYKLQYLNNKIINKKFFKKKIYININK